MSDDHLSADDINWTMRQVFGDGDIAGYVHVTDETDDVVWTHQLREPRLSYERPVRDRPRRPRTTPPPPRVLPRFRELVEAPGPPPAIAHPAVAAAKTWLYAATHQPSDQTKDALLSSATSIVRGLLGDTDG